MCIRDRIRRSPGRSYQMLVNGLCSTVLGPGEKEVFSYGFWPYRDRVSNHRRHISGTDEFPYATGHGIAAKQGSETVS